MTTNPPPNFLEYHKSLAGELSSLQDRVRNLVPHWPSDGEYKEVLLRSVLRRHLPNCYLLGRGFVVTRETASRQIDILIANSQCATLFRDGDVLVVTGDAVMALIEVKTSASGFGEIADAVRKLTDNAHLCRDQGQESAFVWTGLFVYNGPATATPQEHEMLLKACGEANSANQQPLNCIAYGPNTFVRYWDDDEIRRGEAPPAGPEGLPFWESYVLESLAPTYFLGNLLDGVGGKDDSASYAWYPGIGGKQRHAKYRLNLGQSQAELIG